MFNHLTMTDAHDLNRGNIIIIENNSYWYELHASELIVFLVIYFKQVAIVEVRFYY